jgi:hypothetical protein
VPQARIARQRAPESRTKTATVVVFLACAAAAIGMHFSSSLQGSDFPDFYCAARMLLDGRGRQLYDAALQYRYQAEYAGRVGTLYIHPPFEALLYLGVAWLPLKYAYILWSFLSLLLLSVSARQLAKAALPAWDWRILAVFALTFVPLLLCLIQGQDSVLMLLLVVSAFVDLRLRRDFSAGCWLALGLFKFQIVLPIVVVLLLAPGSIRKRAFASGFFGIGVSLMGLSAAISGWSVFSIYPNFLIHLPAQPFAGIIPQAMPNFRGLAFTIFDCDQSPWAMATVSVLSAAAFIYAVNPWKRQKIASTGPRNAFDLAFSTTVLFSLLVSYHLNPHDLTLLLLPLSLTLHDLFAKCAARPEAKESAERKNPARADWTIFDWTTLALLAVVFLPPLHLLALKAHRYALIAIPLTMLFFAIRVARREDQTSDLAAHVDND